MTNIAKAQVLKIPIVLFVLLTQTALPAPGQTNPPPGSGMGAAIPGGASFRAVGQAIPTPGSRSTFSQNLTRIVNRPPEPPVALSNTLIQPEAWNDSGKEWPQVEFGRRNRTIAAVASDIESAFSNEFDVILPYGKDMDWNVVVPLNLRNVTATDIFNAMNLWFATSKTPLRWELMLNGNRRTAVLQTLSRPQSQPVSVQVFFVGDLLSDSNLVSLEKSHVPPAHTLVGTTWDDLMEIIQSLRGATPNASPVNVTAYRQAQLLVVRGTPDDIALVHSTLEALRQKVQWDRSRGAAVQANTTWDTAPSPNP